MLIFNLLYALNIDTAVEGQDDLDSEWEQKIYSSHFSYKNIWKCKVPPKIGFFGSTASLGTILTIDNLRKHGIIILDWCYLCKKLGNYGSDFVTLGDRFLWDQIFNWPGVEQAMPKR